MKERKSEQSEEKFFKYEIMPTTSPNYTTTHYTRHEENIPTSVAIKVREIGYGAIFGVMERYIKAGKKYKLLRVQKSSQPENIKEKIISFNGTFAIEVPDDRVAD